MIILIDGYNVLKQVFSNEITSYQRKQFVDWLVHYARVTKHKIVLVFDGDARLHNEPNDYAGDISVIYAGFGKIADDLILDFMDKNYDQEMLLVSNDQELVLAGEKHDIPSIDALGFYQLLKNRVAHEKGKDHVPSSKKLVKLIESTDPEVDNLMAEYTGDLPVETPEQRVIKEKQSRKLSKIQRKLERILKKL